MIGVYQVEIDINTGNISIEFETPANLNSIEKKFMMLDIKSSIDNTQIQFIEHIFKL